MRFSTFLNVREIPNEERIADQLIQQYQESPSIRFPWSSVEQEQLPSQERLNKDTLQIEIMGLPNSGKSSMLDYVERRLEEENPETRVEVFREFALFPFDYKEVTEGKPLSDNLFQIKIQQALSSYWTTDILSQRNYEDFNSKMVFCERGCSDVLSLCRAKYLLENSDIESEGFIEGIGVENFQSFIRDPFGERKDFVRTLALLWNLSKNLDAVILYGTSFETSLERRRMARGTPSEGTVVNERVFPALDFGYSWWLEYIYPKLREKYGVGLLIINGEDDLDENNERVFEYLQEMAK